MMEDGGVEDYALLSETLDDLRRQKRDAQAALAALSEIDPERLWAWVSLRAAEETRRSAGRAGDARSLSQLQLLADRNRGLASSPVRKDLLLQDWLIQWARIGRTA